MMGPLNAEQPAPDLPNNSPVSEHRHFKSLNLISHTDEASLYRCARNASKVTVA